MWTRCLTLRKITSRPNGSDVIFESKGSLLALPSPSNVMGHKEMLIWHKETLKSEKGGVLVNSCFGWKRIGSGEDVAEVGIEKNVKEKKKSRGNGKKCYLCS